MTNVVTKPALQRHFGRGAAISLALLCAAFVLVPVCVRGDQVQMQNGDSYYGRVLSLSQETLVIQSEVLGTLRLPRAKVAHIILGTNTVTNAAVLPVATNRLAQLHSPLIPATNSASPGSSSLAQLGASSNILHQIETQFLSDAGPEAKAKFNELAGGLLNGSLSMDNLRAEAKSAADQLRSMRKDGGSEGGWTMDAYLAILDNFLKETAPANGPSTNNAPALAPK